MKRVIKNFLLADVFLLMVLSSCKKGALPDNALANTTPANLTTKAAIDKHGLRKKLVTGLGGGLGSTVGPGGDLFIPDGKSGTIFRVDPETGDYTTFASGLPPWIPEAGIGGISDLVFRNNKAYALVTLVDDPTLFPTGQVNGIYRIDGLNSHSVIADIGAFNIANPPSGFNIDVSTGVLFSIESYRDGFLVTDGHFNRVLYVTLDGRIEIVKRFNNIVPTGMALQGNQVYMSEAGPVPHLPQNGKVVSFNLHSPAVTTVASGAPLVIDVEFGRGQSLFALSQGDYSGEPEGSPALPNTGALVQVTANGTFGVIEDKLDRPTSLEIIGNTAYIITLDGDIWTIEDIAGPPYGRAHRKHLLHRHN